MVTFCNSLLLPNTSKLPFLLIVLTFVSTSYSESFRGCKFFYSTPDVFGESNNSAENQKSTTKQQFREDSARSTVGSKIKEALSKNPDSHLEYLISKVLSDEVLALTDEYKKIIEVIGKEGKENRLSYALKSIPMVLSRFKKVADETQKELEKKVEDRKKIKMLSEELGKCQENLGACNANLRTALASAEKHKAAASNLLIKLMAKANEILNLLEENSELTMNFPDVVVASLKEAQVQFSEMILTYHRNIEAAGKIFSELENSLRSFSPELAVAEARLGFLQAQGAELKGALENPDTDDANYGGKNQNEFNPSGNSMATINNPEVKGGLVNLIKKVFKGNQHSEFKPSFVKVRVNKTFRISTENRQHTVTLTKPFEIMSVLTTRGMWKKVADLTNEYLSIEKRSEFNLDPKNFVDREDERLPVAIHSELEIFSWLEALNVLSSMNNNKLQIELSSLFPNHYLGKKYRLPTIAEWEYAARNEGNVDYNEFARLYSGRKIRSIGSFEWTWRGHLSKSKLNPVGLLNPIFVNGQPMYDLFGNIGEATYNHYGQGELSHLQPFEKVVLKGFDSPGFYQIKDKFYNWEGILFGFRLASDIPQSLNP